MKCFYHNDLDGKCAGAIVYKAYKRDNDYNNDYTKKTGKTCKFISIDYNQDFPFGDIKKNELIVIVDFSLQKEGEFKRLLEITNNVIWIDHHKTAIEKHGQLALTMKGVRVDGVAGCELTWRYFYPNHKMPRVVKLLGDYDVWAFKYGDEARNLQTGIGIFETNPEHANWVDWFNDNRSCDSAIEAGKTINKYCDNRAKSLIKGIAFFADFEGYRAVCCNSARTGSQLFDSVLDHKYDIMMPFYFDGKQWTVSLYTEKNEIDVSKIAVKYGGGGHRKAAGFQCKELPFKRGESN